MKDLLYVEFRHLNNSYHRSGNLTDLELAVNTRFAFCEPFSYKQEKALLNSLLTISDDDYTPADKDKLYFLPGTSVPRIKLKDLATDRGIKTTRKIEDAHAIFASRGTLNKLTDTEWMYAYDTDDFKKYMEGIKPFMEEYDYEKVETALKFYTEPYVLSDYSGNRILGDNNLSFRIDTHPKMETGSNRFLKVKEGKEEVCKALLGGGLATIYDESAILKHVNGDNAVTIDGEIYDNINMMFDSSDTDNHILAMEIMANSNYNDSLLYIQMLFMNHHSKMDSLREKNHVNFKSLLSYLGKTNQMYSDMDTIMASLRDNGRLTEENIEILLTHEANRNLALSGSYRYFKIKSITLDPEYLKELNSNYTFELQKDIEVVIEEEPEIEPEAEEEITDEIATEKVLEQMEPEVNAIMEIEEEEDTEGYGV